MNPTAIPAWFVVVMGMGIVFAGLICIVFLCMLMSRIVMAMEAKSAAYAVPVPTAVPVPAAAAAPDAIPNRQELIAAISAALAEELGTDVSAIRILSFKPANKKSRLNL